MVLNLAVENQTIIFIEIKQFNTFNLLWVLADMRYFILQRLTIAEVIKVMQSMELRS